MEGRPMAAMQRYRRFAVRRRLGIGLVALTTALAGCGPPDAGTGGAGALLYVANGFDGTITRLDVASGRVVGPPLTAGPGPAQVVAGPGGSALVLSLAARSAGGLVHIVPTGSGWASRSVTLNLDEPPGRRARGVLLAGDGGRYAAAAFPVHVAGPMWPPCRLALIDLATGAVARVQVVCSAGESLYSLALASTAAGPVVYVGLWRAPVEVDGRLAKGSGAVLAVQTATGAVTGRASLAGVPEQLVLAAAPGQQGGRLYCVEGTPGPEVRDPIIPGPPAERWQLVGLDPVTLNTESTLPLREPPAALAFTPDGNDAYFRSTHTDTRRAAVLHVDLTTGDSRPLIVLPGQSMGGLVVAGDRLYVPHSWGSEVWAVDRLRGRLTRAIPVGRGPLGLTLVQP
jgi:DNA-binding beta-propeller fold protein YncE